MLNQEDLKWIASTSTELNSILQQISRYSDLARQHKGEHSYIDMLGERVELASKKAQSLFDRVTSTILDATTFKGKRQASPPRFSVVSPANSAPSDPPAAANASAPSEISVSDSPDCQILNPEGRRELILLVDDDPEILDVAAAMLTLEGYRVILAKDGLEALKIYKRLAQEVRLVILDFFLPIMDGDAVFDELRTLNPKVDVVLSSGFAEQGKVNAMLAEGLRGFIPKPYTREKLLHQVRTTLDADKNLVRS